MNLVGGTIIGLMAIAHLSAQSPKRRFSLPWLARWMAVALAALAVLYLASHSFHQAEYLFAIGPPMFAAVAFAYLACAPICFLDYRESARRMARGSALEEYLAAAPVRSHTRRVSGDSYLSAGDRCAVVPVLDRIRSLRTLFENLSLFREPGIDRLHYLNGRVPAVAVLLDCLEPCRHCAASATSLDARCYIPGIARLVWIPPQ